MKAFAGMMNTNCGQMVDVEKSARPSFPSLVQIWCEASLVAKHLETIMSYVDSRQSLDHCDTWYISDNTALQNYTFFV